MADRFDGNDAAQPMATIGGAIGGGGGRLAHVVHQTQSAALASRGVRAIRRRRLDVQFGEVRRRTLQLLAQMFRNVVQKIHFIQSLQHTWLSEV